MNDINSNWHVGQQDTNLIHTQSVDQFRIGEIAALCFENFISNSEATSIVSALLEVGIEYYYGDDKNGSVVKKGKIGPNYFRFKDDPSKYFSRVKQDIHVFRDQIIRDVSLLERLYILASDTFGLEPVLASHNQQDMMPCTIRDLPFAPLHRDWLKGEVENLDFLEAVQDQWAWNIYLTTPNKGGETGIYDQQNLSNLELNTPVVFYPPITGNLLFFRSTNIHEVKESEGDRYTLSGFCGPTNDGRLLFWV